MLSKTGWDNVQKQTFYKEQRQHLNDDTPSCFHDGENSIGGFMAANNFTIKGFFYMDIKESWEATKNAECHKGRDGCVPDGDSNQAAVCLSEPGGTMRKKNFQTESAAWLLHHSWDPPSHHKLACWHEPVFRALNQLCALRLMDWIVTMAVKIHKKKPSRPQERCI